MKRFLCALLAVCLIFSFAACSSKSTEEVIETLRDDKIVNAYVILFKDSRGEVLFYNSDIERVYARRSSETGYFIELEMNEQGTEKLKNATTALVGEDIKMFIKGVPIVSMKVEAPIESGEFILSRHATQNEMYEMFDRLT